METLRQDNEDSKRRLCWFLMIGPFDSGNTTNKFKHKSTWNLPKGDPLLKSYFSLVDRRLLSVAPYGKSHSNLTSSELSVLKVLKSDSTVVSRWRIRDT